MAGRNKISIVLGEAITPRFLSLFKSLSERADLTVYAFRKNDLFQNFYLTNAVLRAYEPILEMPGYIRGLEEQLEEADLIIGIEPSKLATFQANRAAIKYQKPFIAVINEFTPYFYLNYPNIRAIRQAILESSNRYWATSKKASEMLQTEGVSSDKISQVSPTVGFEKFHGSSALRKKFRDYVHLNEDDLVILFQGDLEPWTKPEQLLQVLKILQIKDPERSSRVKVLFVGNGSMAQHLRYYAFDTKLGGQTLFLQQNPEPFLADLYNSCDVAICPRWGSPDVHEPFPLNMMEAASCGVIPIVSPGTICHELLGEAGTAVDWDSPLETSAVILKFLQDPSSLKKGREKCFQYVIAHFDEAETSGAMENEVNEIIDAYRKKIIAPLDMEKVMAELEAKARQGETVETLIKIEEFLLGHYSSYEKSLFHFLKGNIYQMSNDTDKAILAFQDSLILNNKNHLTYRALGLISWQKHSHEEALTFFKKALAIKGDDPQTILGIGLVYKRLQLFEEAIFWLEKCIHLDIVRHTAMPTMIQSCLECKKTDLAIATIERVIELLGESQPLLLTLAQLHLKNGDTKIGNELMEKALLIDSEKARAC